MTEDGIQRSGQRRFASNKQRSALWRASGGCCAICGDPVGGMIQARLDFPPSTNRLWRYSSKGTAYLTPEAKAWKQAASWIVAEAVRKQSAVLGPFHAHIEVGRPDKRRRDLDNLLKITLDAVQAGGAIRNDSDAESVFAQWVPDLKGVRVTITPAGDA